MSNARRRFEGLIPGRRKSIATVVTDNGDGTATVTSPQGNDYKVATGGVTVANGDKVVVRDGQIRAKAPAMTVYQVSV